MPHPDTSVRDERVAILRSGYEAWSRRDLEGALEVLDRDIDFYPSPHVPGLGRHYRGHAGVSEAWAIFQDSFEHYRLLPERFVRRGDQVGVLGRFQARGRISGVEVAGPFAHVYTFDGAKVVCFDGDTEKNAEMLGDWE